MGATKPVLILQLRPEDATADSEYACFLKYGDLRAVDICRMCIEQDVIPNLLGVDDYAAIIVGGSPFDISIPENQKSMIQKNVETDFNR